MLGSKTQDLTGLKVHAFKNTLAYFSKFYDTGPKLYFLIKTQIFPIRKMSRGGGIFNFSPTPSLY